MALVAPRRYEYDGSEQRFPGYAYEVTQKKLVRLGMASSVERREKIGNYVHSIYPYEKRSYRKH